MNNGRERINQLSDRQRQKDFKISLASEIIII